MFDIKDFIKLFFLFFKISFITFGGGYTCLPIMEKELVEKHKIITREELLSNYALAQMMPGLVTINLGVLIGYKRSKLPGAIAIMLGTVIPPLIIGIIIAKTMDQYMESKLFSKIFWGIRVGVSVLILNVVIKLIKQTDTDLSNIVFILLSAILYYFFGISPIYIIILVVLVSIFIVRIKNKKEGL